MTCPRALLDGRERRCLNDTPGHTAHIYLRTHGLLRLEVIEGPVAVDPVGVPGNTSTTVHARLSPVAAPTGSTATGTPPAGAPSSPGSVTHLAGLGDSKSGAVA